MYSWSSQNTGGDTKRKVTTGIMFIGQSAGNIIGPHLYTTGEAPLYERGLRSNLALFVVIIVLAVLCNIYLITLNKRHAKTRVELGKPEKLDDRSMGRVREGNAPTDEKGALENADSVDRVGEKAFDDETDLRNEDFIYVY